MGSFLGVNFSLYNISRMCACDFYKADVCSLYLRTQTLCQMAMPCKYMHKSS